jgi:hypothetical protein
MEVMGRLLFASMLLVSSVRASAQQPAQSSALAAVAAALAAQQQQQQQASPGPVPQPPKPLPRPRSTAAPRPAPPPKPVTELDKAIEEFKSQTRTGGMRADSPVRATQAWWKKWHGRMYENLRNDIFDAVPHEIRQRGSDKSLLRRNQFGFNASGPLVFSKTYLSVSYEGMRERISRSYLTTVATTPERTGDFSGTVDSAGQPLHIFDEGTTHLNSQFDPAQPVTTGNLQYVRLPFPGNVIPASRLDPVAQAIVTRYPAPNANVGPFDRNNYFVVSPETNRANGVILKIDHTFSDHQRLAWSATISDGFAGSSRYFPQAPDIDPNPSDRNFTTRRSSLSHTITFSPRTVNTISFDVSSDRHVSAPVEGETPCAVLSLGAYIGICRPNPSTKYGWDSFVWTDSASIKRDRNTIRLVAQLAAYRVNVFAPTYPAGLFSFGTGITSLPGIVDTGHPFAGFLLGLAESGELSVVPSPSYFRRKAGELYVSDRYQVRPNLSITVGLNLNMSAPRVEKYDRQSTVDLTRTNPITGRLGMLVAAGRDGYSRGFQPFHARTEPAISVAWNPRADTRNVVRLSYSRSYGNTPIYSVQWGTQGFKAHPYYVSTNDQLEPALTLSQGLPPLTTPLPDLSPSAADNSHAELVEPTGRQATYSYAAFSYERQLPAAVVVTAGTTHQTGDNLLVGSATANPNAISLDNLVYRDQLNDEAFRVGLRPYQQFLSFDVYAAWPSGHYERDAAYLRVDKRTSAGVTLAATYEFSKQMDDYSSPYGVQDFYNLSDEWSLCTWNAPHHLSLTYGYELPFGANKGLFAYSDWRRYLVEGWAVSGITSMNSGRPVALRPQFNNTGGLVTGLRVNVVSGVDPRVADQGPQQWFNPAAFDQPADFATGNAARTYSSVMNPGAQNHDLSVTKRFALDAERSVELSAVGLNFLNHANWNNPDPVIGPASAPNVNAGKIIGSSGGRILQVGLRYSF